MVTIAQLTVSGAPPTPGLLQSIIPSLMVAFITAIFGFFWFVAYRHPGSFKTFASPVLFACVIAFLLALGFTVACTMILQFYSGIAHDHAFDFIADRAIRETLGPTLTAHVAPVQRVSLYVCAGTAVSVLFLAFFGFASRRLRNNADRNVKDA